MGDEVHIYSPAYKPEEIQTLSRFAHSLVFNSAQQLNNGLSALEGHRRPELGLRVNPEYSEVEVKLYDPCAPSSRPHADGTRVHRDRYAIRSLVARGAKDRLRPPVHHQPVHRRYLLH